MKVGIIGCGLIGEKRASAIDKSGDKVVMVADINLSSAKELSKKFGASFTNDWKDVVNSKEIEVVVISTPHNLLSSISLAALKSGKHVLCEKPLGINPKEVKRCVDLAKKKKLNYKAGYNHRFHPSVSRAKKLYDKGKIGKIMYIRGIYGHGGRPGYEKEWRVEKKISGGGELIDQGAHLIDLVLWFNNNPATNKSSILLNSFWPIKVEDNVFILLKSGDCISQIHASWTEWKNKFSFEIFGTKGYLKLEGLGGSYGTEKLFYGLRIPGRAPKEKIWEYTNIDISWNEEWKNLKKAINKKTKLVGSGEDGYKVLKVIESIYNTHK